ncbi:unnamed protein product [Urochloa humidicola]
MMNWVGLPPSSPPTNPQIHPAPSNPNPTRIPQLLPCSPSRRIARHDPPKPTPIRRHQSVPGFPLPFRGGFFELSAGEAVSDRIPAIASMQFQRTNLSPGCCC